MHLHSFIGVSFYIYPLSHSSIRISLCVYICVTCCWSLLLLVCLGVTIQGHFFICGGNDGVVNLDSCYMSSSFVSSIVPIFKQGSSMTLDIFPPFSIGQQLPYEIHLINGAGIFSIAIQSGSATYSLNGGQQQSIIGGSPISMILDFSYTHIIQLFSSDSIYTFTIGINNNNNIQSSISYGIGSFGDWSPWSGKSNSGISHESLRLGLGGSTSYDEIRIWMNELSAKEILRGVKSNSWTADGIIAHYTFARRNSGSSSSSSSSSSSNSNQIAYDESGNGYIWTDPMLFIVEKNVNSLCLPTPITIRPTYSRPCHSTDNGRFTFIKMEDKK